MRHKLEEKRREKELNRPYNPQHNCSETDSRPLDELLAFIEGDEEGEGGGVSSVSMTTNNTSKPGKKKKKTKKILVIHSFHLLANSIPIYSSLTTVTPGNN
ncbi:hypothetical protein GBAR_LOCUS10037, partial [Geodia barretti]